MKKNFANYEINIFIFINLIVLFVILSTNILTGFSQINFAKQLLVNNFKKTFIRNSSPFNNINNRKQNNIFDNNRNNNNDIYLAGSNEYINFEKHNNDIPEIDISKFIDYIKFKKFKFVLSGYLFNKKLIINFEQPIFFSLKPNFVYSFVIFLLSNLFIYLIILYIRKKVNSLMLPNKNNEDYNNLSASLAHELKNPLAGISMFIELLERKIKNEPETDYIDNIKKQIRNLNKIISNFINYARPFKINKIQSDISQIISEIINDYKNEIRDISITKEVMNATIIKGDSVLLKQVFLNIFLNAVDALEGINQKHIHFSIYNQNNYVIIDISNNGNLIEEHEKQRIFDPFFTNKIKGSGLGLPISKKIIEEHGGKLLLAENTENNTVFRIILRRDT
ncbi:MAG: HAMP domain-containing histidine kinase [Candidatus Muirbacterium halophilum]|nr:HAMP domain-containing histidine kinase [Candidatus Muirbacterium halophilum]